MHNGVNAALAASDSEARKSEAMWQQWTTLICLDSRKPRLALNMQFPAKARKQQIDEYWGDEDDTMKTMLNGTLATEIAIWKNHQTQLVLRQMTQNFLKSLMATWKTLMHPHLKCMHQQVEVVKKTGELLSRVKSARSYFPYAGVGAFGGLAHPSTDRKPAKSRGKRKSKTSSHKSGHFPNLGTPAVLPNPHTSRSESRQSMSTKRPTETGTTRGGQPHTPRLRPDQCILSRQVEHRTSECSKQKKSDFDPWMQATRRVGLVTSQGGRAVKQSM